MARRELERSGPRPYKRDLPVRALLMDRRAKAMNLKLQGFSLLQIGLKLHADPAANADGVGFPGGYGWRNLADGRPPLDGSVLAVTVSKDLAAGLKQARLASEAIRQESLTLMLERLDRAAAAIWPRVMTGEPRAQEVWLSNMDRQIDLLGIRPAVDVHVVVEGPQPVYNPEFSEQMFAALTEIGAIDSADIVDAEVVECPS